MPRFYFHVYDDGVARDEEGRELPDIDAARCEAVKGARELMCDEVRRGNVNLSHRVEVEDERGQRLLVVHFQELVVIQQRED